MTKLAKRLSAAVAAGAVLLSLTASANAANSPYNCPSCNKTTTYTLDVYSSTATATTSINDGQRGVSVSIYAEYYAYGTARKRTTGNGNSGPGGVSTSVSNNGGSWSYVKSTHSKCCDIDHNLIWEWPW